MDRGLMADVDHEGDAVRMSGSCGCNGFSERTGEKVLTGVRLDRHIAVHVSRF